MVHACQKDRSEAKPIQELIKSEEKENIIKLDVIKKRCGD